MTASNDRLQTAETVGGMTNRSPETPYECGDIPMPYGSTPPRETQQRESYGIESGRIGDDSSDTRSNPQISPLDKESPPTMPMLDKRVAMEYDMGMASIQDTIRSEIKKSGKTRYAIWKESGISQSHLSLFMRKQRGMTITMLERIAPVLNLEIIIRPKRRKKRK